MSNLIDRRLNPGNKSAGNRERFMRRYKAQIRKAVHKMVEGRGISDMQKGGDVDLPARDISEPTFRHNRDGDREIVHPGNKEFSTGDALQRPRSGNGRGNPKDAGHGDSVDDFRFTLSREEFMNIFFEDMELPNLAKTVLAETPDHKLQRAGYSTSGTPTNLSIVRTVKTAMGRRIAMVGALQSDLEAVQENLALAETEGRADDVVRLRAEIAELEQRITNVPFLDDLDLRYRQFTTVPAPAARAVMFCLMDVSASMSEHKKDLAKRFFTLLYMFLERKYGQGKVELVFIRHTDDAEEVNEEEFFYGFRSGGTVVLSALQLMEKVISARYSGSEWNIYGAQASDGDAFGDDGAQSADFLDSQLLNLVRYFAYIDIPDEPDSRNSPLWMAYDDLSDNEGFAMKRAASRADIYPVFHSLFTKEKA